MQTFFSLENARVWRGGLARPQSESGSRCHHLSRGCTLGYFTPSCVLLIHTQIQNGVIKPIRVGRANPRGL
ncbi:hypothetical protein QQF64_000537 [Cirrhinus molitorella]|uniref:Uncharacterized protein n=1 Tax=Cirrhinus molitorella TaxID=172907 RepID=A0ABR3NXT6_9TELE